MARMRRNQAAPAPTDGSCYYDTAVGFLDGTAAAASATMEIEPEFSQFMKAEAAVVTVTIATDRTLNGRALIKSVRVNACDLESFNEADGVAAGGRVAPDEFQSGDGECCLGKPVCWGWFGKAALNQELEIRFTNVSNDATDIYASVAGRQSDSLAAGQSIGRRCPA